ncbi:MAG: DUF4212 domain-containing protein [Myxococcota bacterium]
MSMKPSADVAKRYWAANVRLVGILLSIWALVGFGCGILFAPWLNQFRLPLTSYPLGFWFAQQGAILVFVILVVVYVVLMDRIEHDAHLD